MLGHVRTSDRVPGLDLLRAIAIATVMLYHVTSYGPRLPDLVEFGYMGVDLFFVLSGFLIGGQLLQPYTEGRTPRWAAFFVRRAFRVLPAYLVVVAMYFAFPVVRESPNIQPLWQFLTFTQNIFPDYFHARALSHAWSLCIEEHFYLLLPPMVWLLARRPGASKVVATAVALMVGGMVLRGWIWEHDVAPYLQVREGEGNFFDRYIENIYNPTYARLDGLLAGVMLAVIKAFRPAWWSAMMRHGCWFLVAGLLGVGIAMSLPSPGYASAVFGFPLLSASLAAILVSAVNPNALANRMPLPGVATLASMAFSLYLTNKAAYHLVRSTAGDSLAGTGVIGLTVYLLAALVCGTLLYLLVERPALVLRERLFHRRDGAGVSFLLSSTTTRAEP